jgi:hypothetical protein
MLAMTVASSSYAAKSVTKSAPPKKNSITSVHVKNESLVGADIKNGTLAGIDIKDKSLTAADLANGAVGALQLQPGSIGSAAIADGSIQGTDILDGTITGTDIQDESLTGAKLLNGSIQSVDIADGAVNSAKVQDGTIDVADLTPAARAASSSAPMQPGQVQRGLFGLNSTGSTPLAAYQTATISFSPPTGAPVLLRKTTAAGNGAECPSLASGNPPASGNFCLYIVASTGGPTINTIYNAAGQPMSSANGTPIPAGAGLLIEYNMGTGTLNNLVASWAVTQ